MPVISSHQHEEARLVLETKSNEVGAPIKFIDELLATENISLKGKHQRENASLAIAAVKTFLPNIKTKDCLEGILTTTWRGRFEQFRQDSKFDIVVDGAHNREGALALVSTWKEIYGEEKGIVIFSAAANKDLKSIIKSISEIASFILVTNPDTPRKLADYNEICRYISKNIDVRREASVNKAIELARTLKGHILIAGSLFLVGEALAIIDNKRQIFEPSDQ